MRPNIILRRGPEGSRWCVLGRHVGNWANQNPDAPDGRFVASMGVLPATPDAVYCVGGVNLLLGDMPSLIDFQLHSEVGKTLLNGAWATRLRIPIPVRSSRIEVILGRHVPIADIKVEFLLGTDLVTVDCCVPHPVNPRDTRMNLLSIRDFLAKDFMFCFDRDELHLFRHPQSHSHT